MSETAHPRCRRCGDPHTADELDPRGWCDRCRERIIRRATAIASAVAVLGTLAGVYLVFFAMGAGERFLILWIVLAAALYFFLYKLVRRVAFAVIRGRADRSRP